MPTLGDKHYELFRMHEHPIDIKMTQETPDAPVRFHPSPAGTTYTFLDESDRERFRNLVLAVVPESFRNEVTTSAFIRGAEQMCNESRADTPGSHLMFSLTFGGGKGYAIFNLGRLGQVEFEEIVMRNLEHFLSPITAKVM